MTNRKEPAQLAARSRLSDGIERNVEDIINLHALLDKIKVHLKPNANPAIQATWDKLEDLQLSNCDGVMDMAEQIRNADKEFQRFGIKFP
jgi:hypothetical protein